MRFIGASSLLNCPAEPISRTPEGPSDAQAWIGSSAGLPISLLRPCPLEPRLLDQAFVLLRDQMALNLRHRIHRHADHDQDRRTAEGELLHVVSCVDDLGDETDESEI